MKRHFQAAVLFSALFLGQQAFAQENNNKNPFYIPRFSRENAAKQLSYQDSRNYRGNRNDENDGNQEFSQNYIQKIEPYENGRGELAEFAIETPVLSTLYEISTDRKPFQLFNNKINLSFFSSRRSKTGTSWFHGIIRTIPKIFRQQP